MLVLSRRKDEAVVVGEGAEQVQVVVLGVRGQCVRLGFKGAREVLIRRGEHLVESREREVGNATNRT